MYFPIKTGHEMGARTKSLWVGTTSFPGLLRDYTGLPTSSSTSQPSHPNWIDVHKDHFRLWTKASIWSMIRSRPVYALKECIFGYSIIQYCWWLYGIWTPQGATSNMGTPLPQVLCPRSLSLIFISRWIHVGESVSDSATNVFEILGIFEKYLWHISRMSWAYFGDILGMSWLVLVLGIFEKYLIYILGISLAYLGRR